MKLYRPKQEAHISRHQRYMNPLLIQFRDNKRAHADLHLWLESYSRTADTYYLAIEGKMVAQTESADKVRRVLAELLGHWINALAQTTPSRPAFLPYDFSDQYTGCLQCRPDDTVIEIVPGKSNREGWTVTPSNPSDYFFAVTDFQSDGTAPIRLAREEFLRRIRESIADAESQLATKHEGTGGNQPNAR